jgi:hypothetical protein
LLASQEKRPQRSRDPIWVVEDLAVGDADDVVAAQLEIRVAGSVGLEGGAIRVRLPAVGLDDQALGPPEEVHSVAPDPDVDLRQREAVKPANAPHRPLEAVSGGVGDS